MNIAIIGMGYVGVTSAACLAKQGHSIIGVDVVKEKVNMINNGNSPIIEANIENLIQEGAKHGKLTATTDTGYAVKNCELIFICVGTPANENGRINLEYVERVCREIASAFKETNGRPTVILRSTVFPGTTSDLVIPILEEFSRKKAGIGFGVCYNPEFMREGSSIHDFYNPPKIVVGEYDSASGDELIEVYSKFTNSPIFRTELRVAEMVKYVDNSFHALKVGFANEIGRINKKIGIDSHKVMDIFCSDTKLNISSKYLKPGFAFGGSCLPKDLEALLYQAKLLDIELPIMKALPETNEKQIALAVNMIKKAGKKKIGILGLSFKEGTDDLRESPMVKLVETLIGKGYNVSIYDKYVSTAKIFGANRDYILNEIPHISTLMFDSVDAVVNKSEVIVFGYKSNQFVKVLNKCLERKIVVDLARITENLDNLNENYNGICW